MGQVAFAEDLDVVVGDAFCFFWVVEQVFHGGGEVREVAFYLDEVLVGAVGAEKVVVVLNPLQFVRHNHGAAELPVFERSGVAASCGELADVRQVVTLGDAPSACAINM